MSILSSGTSRLDATRIEEVIEARAPQGHAQIHAQTHSGGRHLVIEGAGPSTAPVRMEAEPPQ